MCTRANPSRCCRGTAGTLSPDILLPGSPAQSLGSPQEVPLLCLQHRPPVPQLPPGHSCLGRCSSLLAPPPRLQPRPLDFTARLRRDPVGTEGTVALSAEHLAAQVLMGPLSLLPVQPRLDDSFPPLQPHWPSAAPPARPPLSLGLWAAVGPGACPLPVLLGPPQNLPSERRWRTRMAHRPSALARGP